MAVQEKLQAMLNTSKMPQFAVVRSMSPVLSAREAERLANAYGSTPLQLECEDTTQEVALQPGVSSP